jgi:bacterial/archaeal transporter family protein
MSKAEWLLPALGFVVANGLLGIATKLALRDVSFGDVVASTCAVYAALGVVVLATRSGTVAGGTGGMYAALTGACAAGGLVFSVLALRTGQASQAVPVMAAYPLVTVAVAVAVLSERVSLGQAIGIGLIVVGLVVLAT